MTADTAIGIAEGFIEAETEDQHREAGEDDTECLDAWDKADMAALGFIEEGA